MATVERQHLTADQRTWAALRAAIDTGFSSRARYPNGTVLIPADTPDLSTVIGRYAGSGPPVVVVHADGHEEYKPRDHVALGVGLVAFVAGRLRRVRV
jgi:hypothetical protein